MRSLVSSDDELEKYVRKLTMTTELPRGEKARQAHLESAEATIASWVKGNGDEDDWAYSREALDDF